MIQFGEKSAFLLVLLLIGAVLLFDTIGMRDDVALVPRVIGWPFVVLTAILLVSEVFPALAKWCGDRLPKVLRGYIQPDTGTLNAGASGPDDQRGQAGLLYGFLGWIAATIALTYILGIFWTSGIDMFLWVKFVNRAGWLLSLVLAAGTFAFVYGVFVVGFSYEYFMRPAME